MTALDDLVESAPCALVVIDADDVVTRVNDTLLHWTGRDGSDVVGATFASLLDVGGQAFYATQLQDVLWSGTGDVTGISLRITRADGAPMPVLLSARAVVDGTRRGAILALLDTTTREDYEREMLIARRSAEESERRIRILQDAATRFLAATTEQELAGRLTDTLRESFSAYDSAVALYDGAGATYRLIDGAQLLPLVDAVRASRTDDRRALGIDDVIAIHDVEEAYGRSDAVGDQLRAVRGAAYVGVPFSDGETVIGAFVAVFGRPRAFDSPELELYRALARQIGLAFSRVRLAQRMRDLATRDQLTGLANRSAIDDALAEAIHQASQTGRPVSLLFLDLDGFKQINDAAGHRAGDAVLQTAATRISASVRDTDLVGRFGGDEFVVVARDTGLDEALRIAERAAAAVSAPLGRGFGGTGVTASVGISVYDPTADSSENVSSLMRRADAAMYESKRAGRNRITASSPR